jgi:hypothetical protein
VDPGYNPSWPGSPADLPPEQLSAHS